MTDPISYKAPSRLRHGKVADVIPFLNTYIARKEQEISEIEQMVDRYEKRRMMKEGRIKQCLLCVGCSLSQA